MGVAAIAAVAAVGSAVISSDSSRKAANKQEDAIREAGAMQMTSQEQAVEAETEAAHIAAGAMTESARIASQTQLDMYEQTRQDQLPWLQAGQQALGQLQGKIAAGPGEFEESPGYQFRLDQGNQNILANQAATGNIASGRTLKAITEYGQDYASNEYDKFLSRYYQSLAPLQSLAGVGQTTAGNLGAQGTQVAGSIAGNQMALGNNLATLYQQQGINQASGYVNQGDIFARNAIGTAQAAGQRDVAQADMWSGLLNTGASMFGSYAGSGS